MPEEEFDAYTHDPKVAGDARRAAISGRIVEMENAFYSTFQTTEGRLVLQFLREQLQVDAVDLSLQGRDNATINAQRDAMKMVYWFIFHTAENGAKKRGDTLVRPTS